MRDLLHTSQAISSLHLDIKYLSARACHPSARPSIHLPGGSICGMIVCHAGSGLPPGPPAVPPARAANSSAATGETGLFIATFLTADAADGDAGG